MEKYILSVADLIRQFVDAKDEKVIEELIKMGWTPPEEIGGSNKEDPLNYHEGVAMKESARSLAELIDEATASVYGLQGSDKKEPAPEDKLTEDAGALGLKDTAPQKPLATFPCLGGGTIKVFAGTRPSLYNPPVNKLIHEAFRTLTHAVHANAVEHGWFDTEMPNKEMEFLVGMAGVMKECGEALEVVSAKEWDVMDEKCPQHTKLVVELADVVLRLLTLCGRHDLNIGAAITAKHEFNRSRPYRHGGKAF